MKAKRAKLEARRRRLKKAKRAASVVLVTDPSKRSYVERVARCFLAQESSEPLELLVVDDDDGSDGDAPAFWVELMKRDRRIRYVKLPEGTSLGEKRRIACEESRFATLVHFQRRRGLCTFLCIHDHGIDRGRRLSRCVALLRYRRAPRRLCGF